MGGKFIQKHKRKGALALLLLLLRSRAKYFLPLLLIVGASTPFIATSENFSRLVEFGPVASFLKFTGLSNAFLDMKSDGSYSAKDLKFAFARARDYDKGSSFWTTLLNKMSSNTPGDSSIDMLRGTDIFKGEDESSKDSKAKNGGAGAEGSNERETGNVDVNAEGLVQDVAGMMEKNGMLGNIMGANLADRQGGNAGYGGASPYMNKDLMAMNGNTMGANLADRKGGNAGYVGVNLAYRQGGNAGYGGASPYMNKYLMAMNGTVGDKYDGKYDNTLDKVNESVPVPGALPDRIKRKMGKASGFAWKNVGYKSKKNNMYTRINSNKRAMFQLAETYSMTGSASTSGDSAPEYQAAYVGSTYDGSDVNADLIDVNDGGSTSVPDTAFTGDLLTGIGDLQQVAQDCTQAQANEGADMTEDADKIDRISKTLGSPPKCCSHDAVRRWNRKLDNLTALCHSFNANAAVVSEKCQGTGQTMDCGQWGGMKISPCSKLKCWVAFFLILFLFVFTAGIGLFLTAALFGVIKFDLKNLGGKLDAMMSFVASGGDMSNAE